MYYNVDMYMYIVIFLDTYVYDNVHIYMPKKSKR